jgi:hypothetical protein
MKNDGSAKGFISKILLTKSCQAGATNAPTN